jgi:alpha-ketoglutarate-dependent 2,4-dichlorophenoxyacetate dioxygenase
MTVSIRPLRDNFSGEVSGIDISNTLSPNEVEAIEAGMDKYGVLIFHDQNVTDEQQMTFSANFGPPLEGSNTTVKRAALRLDPAFADVSNLDNDGTLLPRDHRRRVSSLGNRLWHSDASFRPISGRYSLLSGRVVPPVGGNTEFADMRAAYDSLDNASKAEIEDLVCHHSLIYSRRQLGFAEYLEEEKKQMTPVRQRLVRVHPSTGRKAIYLSAHIGKIEGWPDPEAMAFIRDLIEHATQRKFVYAHEWRAGDLVIWDNRCTMHRVRNFDDLQYPRDLRRTTTLAEGPTVEQQVA